jgi:hypothetical protein
VTTPPNEKRPEATAGAVAPGGDRKRLHDVTYTATNDQLQEIDYVSYQPPRFTALVIAALRDTAARQGPENAWRDMIALLSGVLLYSLNSSGLEATLTLLADADIVLRRTMVADAPNTPETLH